jgi:hypothetical protein
MFFSNFCDYMYTVGLTPVPKSQLYCHLLDCSFGNIKAETLRSSFLSVLSLIHRLSHLILADRVVSTLHYPQSIITKSFSICRGYSPNQELLIRTHSQLHIHCTSTDGMKPLTIENDISIQYKSSFIDNNDRNSSCNFGGETVRVLQFVSTPRSRMELGTSTYHRSSRFGLRHLLHCPEKMMRGACRLHLPVQPMECGIAVCSRLCRYIHACTACYGGCQGAAGPAVAPSPRCLATDAKRLVTCKHT